MTVHVHVGPTLPADEVLALLPHAVIHPPIAHGDPFRIDPAPGDVVAVIDGLFFQSGAVRHKELLWLLDRGVRVVGSSSMGALRAAELDRFGMRGVGQVYQAFSQGRLDADDEVAVVHADAEDGWTCYSDALVNLRTAAARATSDAVLTPTEAAGFVATAQGTFFGQRRAVQVVRTCRATGLLDPETAADLTAWLATNAWDAKAEDARLLLNELAFDSWLVRPRDDDDWPIGDLPGFVHDWARDLRPIDPRGATAGQAEALVRLFASDATETVARVGSAAVAESWGLDDSRGLAEHCAATGLAPPDDPPEELLDRFLDPEERHRGDLADQVALALARSAFPTTARSQPRPAYPAAAVALAARVSSFNDELALTAPHHRPEFVAAATVDRYFAQWWEVTDLDREVRRRGFRDLDDFRGVARRVLAFAVSEGVPELTWEDR